MKKKILFLLILLNSFLSFATGLKNVYWDMPYNKLLMEKQVVEDEMKYEGDEIKILTERKKDDYIFYLFYREKLFSVLVDTDITKKYIKEKKCIEVVYDNVMYGSRYFHKNIQVEYITGIDISKYLFYLEECCDYIDEESNFINNIKQKNIKESKIKISIYQSTENTKAFVFENIIKDETFMVLLPE